MKDLGPVAEETLEWLRESARPPPGVELVSEDGATFTGIVFVERNRPVAMLAVRHEPMRQASRYGPSHNPYASPHQRHLFEEDEEPPPAWRPSRLWDR